MDKKKEFSRRKATRLKDFDYNSVGAYFLTICTENRQKILSRIVGSTPTKQHSMVSRFISTFKRFCNKEYGASIWQMHFNDHIIRNHVDYEEHVKYIYENPIRWYYDELYNEE